MIARPESSRLASPCCDPFGHKIGYEFGSQAWLAHYSRFMLRVGSRCRRVLCVDINITFTGLAAVQLCAVLRAEEERILL